MENKEYLVWVDFYTEFANKLRAYQNDRAALITKIKAVFSSIGIKLPTLERDNNIIDICPFTVFGLFNKGITNANRINIIRGLAKEFGVTATVPESFDGIPVLNNQMATFYWFVGSRGEHDIDNLWDVFVSALDYADNKTKENEQKLIKAWNLTIKQKGVKWNLTMGLYWIRPYTYLNLDGRNRWFIALDEYMPVDYIKSLGKMKDIMKCEEYLSLVESTKQVLEKQNYEYKNFVELSYYAWVISEKVNEENKKAKEKVSDGAAIGDSGVEEVRYWIYTPGYGAEKWDEFYEQGIMCIARAYIGDLSQYSSKKAMQEAMDEKCPRTPDLRATTFSNAALETWEFLKKLKPGDVIFAKKGKHTIIGRGVVASDYFYDPDRDEEYVNVRKVTWTHKGEWEHPGSAITKVLTDITPYTDYVEKLEALFDDELSEEEVEEVKVSYPSYSPEDFLSEVFMSKEKYEILTQLLKNKKNIILQGAPGVGKTFAAKRLCYSIMGVKDAKRVMMIQFHQSYSYEDFIEGYRPEATGFKLKKGPFYKFCREAEKDDENDYFFIIDEINRGNLSKIFGELFMLIENDKRGVSLKLLYSDEKLSVPKNVYIIGIMNTADRSLAMLDYALRRRFAFFEFAPAFDTEGFREYRKSKNNAKFDNLIAAIEKLNIVIEEDATLGKGFRIGHSYFCTSGEIDDMWLNSIITYEIVPLLNEYWFDEPNKVRDWERTLREVIK
jgi:5-methylcytosine-specific restriction protein B